MNRTVVAAVAAAIALLAGCTSSTPPQATSAATVTATPSRAHVVIHVDHPSALVDVSLHITVTGLAPEATVTVEAQTTEATGKRFESQASFTAGGDGVVDLASDAPSSGSYSGVDPMGLFWSMAPLHPGPNGYFDVLQHDGQTVTLTVTAGGATLARRSVVRRPVSPGVSVRRLRPARVGFYGNYYAAPDVSSPGPAILLFGGSEGGLSTTFSAGLLASDGYPTLALAYFDEPGLPRYLQRIPLEYFVAALRWLSRQPGVDPHRLVVWGVSRGGEAALLLGAHFPALVRGGVVAMVGSNVVLCSIPHRNLSSWTLAGKELPCSYYFGPGTLGRPEVAIPVEDIRAPVFMVCGGQDDVAPSCPMDQAMKLRLEAHHHPYRDMLLDYADAGHGVGMPVPYDPFRVDVIGGHFLVSGKSLEGATPDANARARETAWPKLLDFLARI